MKNSLKGLIAASLLVGALHADSQTVTTNKNFMATRALGIFDLARQYTGIWGMIHHKKEKGKFGGFLNVTGLYNQTTGKSRIGRYFGIDNADTIVVGGCGAACNPCQAEVDRSHFIQRNEVGGTLEAQFNFQFEKKRWGVVFDWYQDLSFLCKGMYMYINLPVIHEKLQGCVEFCGCETKQAICGNECNNGCATTPTNTTTEVGITNYFDGSLVQNSCTTSCYDGSTELRDLQIALKCAKVDCCCNQSKTGVGDMDLIVGYDFLRGDDYNLGFNAGMVIPTGNKPHGCFVWEPVIGNGNAFGLGAGFISSFTPWKKNDQALRLHALLKYRYFFRHDEVRTLGLKNQKWAQYQFIGTIGQPGVQPLANVSTFEVKVARQSHVSSLIGASYDNGGFTFDLGYELYAKEHDSVHIDCCPPCACDIGLAGWDYTSCNDFTTGDIARCDTNIQCRGARTGDDTGSTGHTIACCDFDPQTGESGAQLTHKIYAGAAYTARNWEYPVNVRLGGYYEFAGSHASCGSWSIYGGAGFQF